MNEYFGKDTSFTKMSNAYNARNRINIMSDIKGDLIRDQAIKRAEMRRAAGKNALNAGQQAGSNAAWGGAINGIGSAVGGALQGGFSEGGIWNKGLNNGDPGTFGDGLGTGHTDYSWNADPKNYEPGSISSPGWSWDDL